MMLELIQFDNLSWSNALKLMPMAPAGAKSAAICINNSYQNSLKYHYDTRESDKLPVGVKIEKANVTGKQLIERLVNQESELFKLWLKYKQVDIERDVSPNLLLDLLFDACRQWYNVDLKLSFVSEKYLKEQIDIDQINEDYELGLTLDYNQLRYMSVDSLTNLANITQNLKEEYWQVVSEFFDQEDISPFIFLVTNNNVNLVLAFLQEEKVDELLKTYHLSIFDAFALYKEDILDDISTDGVKIVDFLKEKDNDVDLWEIIDLYKNDPKMFSRLLQQSQKDEGLLAKGGYEDFINRVSSISMRNSGERKLNEDYIDSEEQEDSVDEATRKYEKNEQLWHFHSDDSENVCDCSGESDD